MKLDQPKNPNYAATVVRVRTIKPLENCDNVVAAPLLGYQAIVSKDTQDGDLGVLFTAETQLSDIYAKSNNLYRHSEKNVDPDTKGYLEDNRRVKAMKFRGHRSDALFMPLSSLRGVGVGNPYELAEGDVFDTLFGVEVCRKYEVPRKPGSSVARQAPKRMARVDDLMLPKHFDTQNYFKNSHLIAPDDHVAVTQKLHGTSIRIGHTLVQRKLTWLERLARKLGVQVQDREYAFVYGSRNVIKDPENPFAKGEYYGTDIYTEVGSRLKGLLPKGYVVYGEIIGWVPGTSTPIQSGYTYQIPEGQAELYVYRVATINEDGQTVDLSWPALKEFCQNLGLKHVVELHQGTFDEDAAQLFLDRCFAATSTTAVPTEGWAVDEGVCVRKEGITPLVLKAKSPIFLQHETKLLDKGVADIESTEES